MTDKPKHVIHVHTSRNWGGGEDQVFRLVRGLVENGVNTTVLANRKGLLFQKLTECGLPVIALPRLALTPLLPCFMSRLCRSITVLGSDIIHAHDSLATTIGIKIARRVNLPLVLSRRIASPLRKNLFSHVKYSPDRIAGVIAISQTVKEVFAKRGYPRDRIWIVPDGVDIEALDKVEVDMEFRRSYDRRYIVGGVGKLSLKKNWQFMAYVAERLMHSGIEIQWCIAGDGPGRTKLEKLVRQLGIESHFHFLGFRTDATSILKSLDLLFCPSLMEGASIVILKAMVLGTPVVAVNTPGTMESLAGHCWAINQGDIEGAARSVVEALRDGTKRDAIVAAAKASAKSRFPLNLTIDGTVKVYNQVLALKRI
jgi:glycosyltransferase involved in cell wall biosynthesis